jgi:hypothetical protein
MLRPAIFLGLIALILSAEALHAADQLLIDLHRDAGISCAGCHEEQRPKVAPSSAKCVSCHGDQQSLAKKTEQAFPNPHASPHAPPGDVQVCTECHHVHRVSEVSCSTCHRDFFFNVK